MNHLAGIDNRQTKLVLKSRSAGDTSFLSRFTLFALVSVSLLAALYFPRPIRLCIRLSLVLGLCLFSYSIVVLVDCFQE